MSNLANAIVALINTPPGDRSKVVHEIFINSVKNSKFDLESSKESLDQAALLGALNVSVIEAISACIGQHIAGDDRLAEIDAYMRDDKKIYAIKLWRERFNVGLAESKAAVEKRGLDLGIYEKTSYGISFKR